MTDDRLEEMLAIRITKGLKGRLKGVALREMRPTSQVALRALELGLDEIERRGFSEDSARGRGEAFERAVADVLIAYGLLTAAQPEVKEGRPTKHIAMSKKGIGVKKSRSNG